MTPRRPGAECPGAPGPRPEPAPRFLAQRLGVDAATVQQALSGLTSAGLLAEQGGKYRVLRALTIDTRGRPGATLRLRRHWATVGAERLASPGSRDLFAYNVFSVSRADFERIRVLGQQYFREVRAIVAAFTADAMTDAMRNLRDEALMEHRNGETAEFV